MRHYEGKDELQISELQNLMDESNTGTIRLKMGGREKLIKVIDLRGEGYSSRAWYLPGVCEVVSFNSQHTHTHTKKMMDLSLYGISRSV